MDVKPQQTNLPHLLGVTLGAVGGHCHPFYRMHRFNDIKQTWVAEINKIKKPLG